ncbi:MAG: hypothetical protein JXJ04_00055 [Spirochaetales bacterium]|nr:hypothetical protein [Spirochaetales bacterium]
MKRTLLIRIKKLIAKNPLLTGCIFFVLFIGITLFISLYYPCTNTNLWKGFYTILGKPDKNIRFDPEDCKRELQGQYLIMEETETVSFSGFNEMNKISLIHINERLDPLDPRFDHYMHTKKNYFYPDAQHKSIFISTPLHPLLFLFKAHSFFARYGDNVMIPDISITEITILFLTGIIYVVIFLFIYKQESKEKMIGILGIVPWVPCLLSGDTMALLSLFLIYPAWFFLFEEIFLVFKNRVIFKWNKVQNDSLIHRLIILFVILIITVVLTFFQETSTYHFLLSFLADISITASYIIYYFHRAKVIKHRKFEPVPIRLFFKQTYLLAKIKKIPFLLSIGVVIIFFSIYYFYGFSFIQTSMVFPMATEAKKSFTMNNLKGLWDNKNLKVSPEFPDLAEFIVHVAYQEGLLLGKTYTFPSTEGLLASQYKKEPVTGKIMKSKKIVKEYNENWLKNVLMHIPKETLEYMLFHQGKCVTAEYRPIGFHYKYRYPKIHSILLFFLSFLSLFFFDFYLTPTDLYDTKRFAIRRCSKVA